MTCPLGSDGVALSLLPLQKLAVALRGSYIKCTVLPSPIRPTSFLINPDIDGHLTTIWFASIAGGIFEPARVLKIDYNRRCVVKPTTLHSRLNNSSETTLLHLKTLIRSIFYVSAKLNSDRDTGSATCVDLNVRAQEVWKGKVIWWNL